MEVGSGRIANSPSKAEFLRIIQKFANWAAVLILVFPALLVVLM